MGIRIYVTPPLLANNLLDVVRATGLDTVPLEGARLQEVDLDKLPNVKLKHGTGCLVTSGTSHVLVQINFAIRFGPIVSPEGFMTHLWSLRTKYDAGNMQLRAILERALMAAGMTGVPEILGHLYVIDKTECIRRQESLSSYQFAKALFSFPEREIRSTIARGTTSVQVYIGPTWKNPSHLNHYVNVVSPRFSQLMPHTRTLIRDLARVIELAGGIEINPLANWHSKQIRWLAA
jgi:hypothetical protein